MDVITPELWAAADYCTSVRAYVGELPISELASDAYARVCRMDFSMPGFCLIDLGPDSSSVALRQLMIALKREMQRIHKSHRRHDLVFLSLARFDQQVTTKAHRDAGPEECFFMLGYEPSPVRAEVSLSDYARCAFDMGITPHDFLKQHNPMFGPGQELLRPYTTRVECFSNRNFQLLMINNSVAPFSATGLAWQGVLHTATVRNPSDAVRRIVNSSMIAAVPLGDLEAVSDREQEEFIPTTVVRRRGYDKTHLDDET